MVKTKRSRRQEFYEAMPGTMDNYNLFTENYAEDTEQEQAKAKMMRQGIYLVALLIAQVILFIVLIRSTVSLG